MPDQHPDRHCDQHRYQYRDGGVLQVFCDPGGQPRPSAPMGRGEDVGQRLLKEIHAAVLAFTLRTLPARVHGVSNRPPNMISVSTTIARTKIAMMPATIWSLLSDW